MTVCKMLLMLDSVSGPKPVCLQQVMVHLDLESLKLGRCWRCLQDVKRKGVPGGDSSVGECPEDRVIGAHRQGERESWNGWAVASCRLVLGFSMWANCGGSRASSVGRRGPLSSLYKKHRPLTVRRSTRLSTMVPCPSNERARFWTLSRRRRWLSAAPDHTSGQYSRIGRTKPL